MAVNFTIEYIVTMTVAQQHHFAKIARGHSGEGLVGIILLI